MSASESSRPSPSRIRTAALVLLVLGTAGCRSYRPVSYGQIGSIGPGDRVRVTTNTGTIHEFEVTAVDSVRIRGADASYEWGTVRVETKRFSLADSALFAAATGAAVWVVGALIGLGVYLASAF